MPEEATLIRLGRVEIEPWADEKVKEIAERDKRTRDKQAAYIIEQWARAQK